VDVLENLVTFPPRNSATGLPIPLSPGNSGKPSVNQLIARKQAMAESADQDRRNARGWHAFGSTKDACCLIRSQLWRNSVAVKLTVPPDQFLPRDGPYRRPPHGRSEEAPVGAGLAQTRVQDRAFAKMLANHTNGRTPPAEAFDGCPSATTGGLCASRCRKLLMLSQVCRAVRR